MFSDNTVLLSLLGSEDDLSMHQYCTDRLVEWCERNSLVINEKKTKEIIFGLPDNMYQTRVTIHNTPIEIVSAYTVSSTNIGTLGKYEQRQL